MPQRLSVDRCTLTVAPLRPRARVSSVLVLGSSVTNNAVFTTTFTGDLYALNAATGAILLKLALSARTNAPAT